jgi:hypothetical protein
VAGLRVVFADDNYLVNEGVAALLAEIDDTQIGSRCVTSTASLLYLTQSWS